MTFCKGKTFLSIDIKSANFNSLYFHDPALFGGAKTWTEYLKKSTEEAYFHQSKAFRQKVIEKNDVSSEKGQRLGQSIE